MASDWQVRVRRDRAQRLRYRPGTGVADGAAWFTRLIQRFLASDPKEWTPLTCLAAQLLFFEAVLTASDLKSALLANGSARRVDDLVMLEWLRADGRQDRRALASLTVRAVAKIPSDLTEADVEDALQTLERWSGTGLDELLSGGRAWAFLNLPGWLYAHVSGDAPLTGLPPSAWARKESLLALNECERSGHEGERAQGRVMDRFFLGNVSGGGAWLVESILKIVTPRVAGASHAAEMNQKLISLNELSDRLEHADRISSLLLGWAIHLITTGGVRGEPVAPSTLRNYLTCSARQIHAGLAGKEIESMSGSEFEAIYRGIVDRQSAGQRANTATAVNGWHSFLHTTLGVLPIQHLADGDPQLPNANIIWPHERKRIFEWLESAPDSRLNQALRVAFSIAFNARVRITELLYLRLRAALDRGDYFEIHVAPGRKDPPAKSESGRRVLSIKDGTAINVLREWLQRRRTEYAMQADFFFGDPYDPRRISEPGAMILHLSSLLKCATGDSSVSFHTLSHTWVSESISEIERDEHSEIYKIESISVQAGHRASSTTLAHYFHLLEKPLRTQINEALKTISLTSSDAGSWSGIRPETLRKRASLSNTPLSQVLWESLLTHTSLENSIQPAGESSVLSEPIAPTFLSYRACSQLTLQDVLKVLKDISCGKTTDQAACRLDRSTNEVEYIAQIADRFLLKNQRLWALRNKIDHSAPTGRTLEEFCDKNHKYLNFSNADQDKYLTFAYWLQAMPDSLCRVCEAWANSWKWKYLDLSTHHHRDTLLRALHEAAVPPETLAIGFASFANKSDSYPVEILELRSQISESFKRVFGVYPQILPVQKRRDRPDIHLIWSSLDQTEGNDPGPASKSLSGFHALMFASTVWTHCLEKTRIEK